MKCKYDNCTQNCNRGREFCIFHAAPAEKSMSVEAFNKEILGLIGGGYFGFDGFVFPGPIEFDTARFNKSASFKDAEFHGRVQFHGKQIDHHLDFEGAKFKYGADFTGIEFWGEANFRDAVFSLSPPTDDPSANVAGFKDATFSNNAEFTGATFLDGNVSFDGAQFVGVRTDFSHTEFRGQTNAPADVIFRGGDFGGEYLGFRKATFSNCQVEFIGRTFNSQEVDFTKATFDRSPSFFKEIGFHGRNGVSFKDCVFDQVIFDDVLVPDSFVDFSGAEFGGRATGFAGFTVAKGLVNFKDTTFRRGVVRFARVRFTGGRCDFSKASFSGKSLAFETSEISGSDVIFNECNFGSGRTTFLLCKILADSIWFDRAVFDSPSVSFASCELKARRITFQLAQFNGSDLSFDEGEMTGNVSFSHNAIGSDIRFVGARLLRNTSFHFSHPAFMRKGDRLHGLKILFARIQFNPLETFFEGISLDKNPTDVCHGDKPAFVFRYCSLRETYFLNNDMSMFSFHRSAFFEESFFTSSDWGCTSDTILWPLKFTRRFLVLEDIRHNEVGGRDAAYHEVPEAFSHGAEESMFPTKAYEIGEIYQRLKSAADRARNYHMASWFYFNEFEMKRRAIIESIRSDSDWISSTLWLLVSPSLWQYNMYRIFAGYGEKPSWSALWFLIFTTVFTMLHLVNGIVVKGEDGINQVIRYTADWSAAGANTLFSSAFLRHAISSLEFTIQRVIPTSYLPGFESTVMSPAGPWSFFLSLLNSVVLILMVVFTAIGLKRHFRRF